MHRPGTPMGIMKAAMNAFPKAMRAMITARQPMKVDRDVRATTWTMTYNYFEYVNQKTKVKSMMKMVSITVDHVSHCVTERWTDVKNFNRLKKLVKEARRLGKAFPKY